MSHIYATHMLKYAHNKRRFLTALGMKSAGPAFIGPLLLDIAMICFLILLKQVFPHWPIKNGVRAPAIPQGP